MYHLGDSTPLILRGGGAYNKPEAAAPYTPPPAPSVPLILQGGGTYNYPEVYGASTGGSSYTPPQRAQADLNKLLMVVAAAVGIGFLLPGGSRRSLW